MTTKQTLVEPPMQVTEEMRLVLEETLKFLEDYHSQNWLAEKIEALLAVQAASPPVESAPIAFDEATGLRELALLYNHADDDSRQFTRWQMIVAMGHGARIATPPRALSKESADEVERVAEALWQEESRRAAGRDRLIPWAEAGDGEKARFRGYARAAIASLTRTQIAATEPAAPDLRSGSVTMSSQTGEAGAANLPTCPNCEGTDHYGCGPDPIASLTRSDGVKGLSDDALVEAGRVAQDVGVEWATYCQLEAVILAALKEGASREG